MEVSAHSPEETKRLAVEVAKKIKKGDVLVLYGDLGSGKTTFTRYLVEALGLKARVQSPTFVLARKYPGDSITVNHLDLYRISSQEEADDLGIDELIDDPESILVVEWPEFIEKYLPEKTIRIKFEYVEENERKIDIQNLH